MFAQIGDHILCTVWQYQNTIGKSELFLVFVILVTKPLSFDQART